jgi:hypothetical protein
MADITNDIEVEGSMVAIVHCDESATEPTRTVLGLTTKDDLSIPIEEENEDYSKSYQRRTERIRTSNTIDMEVTSAMAPDLESLELIGLVDSDGKLSFDSELRQLGPDVYLELHYFADEPDFSTVTLPDDAELSHRGGDVEIANPEVDPSATPPTCAFVAWIEGDFWINYTASGA